MFDLIKDQPTIETENSLDSFIASGQVRVEERNFAVPKPDKVDFSVYEDKASKIQDAYRQLYDWLDLPYIYDQFTDHTERRKWRETLSPAQKILIKRNKLRSNMVGVGFLEVVLIALERMSHPLFSRFKHMMEEEPSFNKIIHHLQDDEVLVAERVKWLKVLEEKVAKALILISQAEIEVKAKAA